jgi:asparaginyl-tRNA synthetase
MPFRVGELIGGSIREEQLELLTENMKAKEVSQKGLEWYLDLRKYGTCKHGGFGLGMERLMMMLTGVSNIRDVIPYPNSYETCYY